MPDSLINKEKSKKKPSLKKIIFSFFVTVLTIVTVTAVMLCLFFTLKILFSIVGVNITYSQGERAGLVIRVSEKGLIWKTWEAEAAVYQGGFSATYIWTFTVDNNNPQKQEIVDKIKTAFQTGRPVKLIYFQTLGTPPWRGSSTYFIKDVIFVDSSQR